MGILLWRCAKPLLSFRREPEIWAWLRLMDGNSLPVTHWENVIGRSKKSDIVIDLPTISRNHAVLTRYDDGSWTITDAASKDGVLVNGEPVQICALEPDDVIEIGGLKMTLEPIGIRQEQRLAQLRTKASSGFTTFMNLLLLTLFQGLCCMAYVLNGSAEDAASIVMGYGGLMAAQWGLLLFYACIRRFCLRGGDHRLFAVHIGHECHERHGARRIHEAAHRHGRWSDGISLHRLDAAGSGAGEEDPLSCYYRGRGIFGHHADLW